MDKALNDIAIKLSDFNGSILDYAILLAAVGTVTMALIELLKSVFDIRLNFHQWRVKKWIGDSAAHDELLLVASGGMVEMIAQTGLTTFATGETPLADAIYDQPTEKMLGQFQAAVNLIMDFPNLYPKAYEFIASPLPGHGTSGDMELWREVAGKLAAGEAVPDERSRAATQARARINTIVARRLDGFQNATQYLWAELNQRASFLLGAVLIILLSGPSPGLHAVLFAVIGGLVAPFAKDVVSALSGLKTKRA